jgi:hypothetical protein
MRQIEDEVWRRRGFTVLWSPAALGLLCGSTAEIISIREFFSIDKNWPDTLPTSNGNALVVTGLEGCLDRIQPSDAEGWLDDFVQPVMLRFQRQYSDDAALIFWMPTGEKRVDVVTLDDTFSWEYAPPFKKVQFSLSRALFGGAHTDAGKIVVSEMDDRGHRKPTWIGVHLPRIS